VELASSESREQGATEGTARHEGNDGSARNGQMFAMMAPVARDLEKHPKNQHGEQKAERDARCLLPECMSNRAEELAKVFGVMAQLAG
jgi:hypothetical protein